MVVAKNIIAVVVYQDEYFEDTKPGLRYEEFESEEEAREFIVKQNDIVLLISGHALGVLETF
jgi:hypothetical protein